METKKKLAAVENKAETANEQVKELPHNFDAEQSLLGALLNNNEYLNRVGDFLMPEHFYEPLHQKIYQSINTFYDKGIIANAITLKNQFQNNEAMEILGGQNYLLQLSSKGMTIISIREFATLIYNLYISRQLIDVANEMLEQSYNTSGTETATAQIEQPESKLFNLASTGFSEKGFIHAKHALVNVVKMADLASHHQDNFNGVTTGFKFLNNLIGGFSNSDLIILAARPSMGKTALALNFAMNAVKHVKNKYDEDLEKYKNDPKDKEAPVMGSVAVISLEMSSEQLSTRLISMKTGINAANIRLGRLNKHGPNDELAKLVDASVELQQLPLFLDDTPALTISAIRTRARRLKRKHNMQFLIVDYLQLIYGVSKKSEASRVQEISEISMGLKTIAKELNIPVMALSQLSRKVEDRPDKKPQLADLRESGSIEQDADVVMFIYREAYYEERKKPSEESSGDFTAWREKMEKIDNVSEIIIAKNRNGPIGNVTLHFNKNTTEFTDPAPEYES